MFHDSDACQLIDPRIETQAMRFVSKVLRGQFCSGATPIARPSVGVARLSSRLSSRPG